MEQVNLEVLNRDIGPDSYLRTIRDEGYIPGVLYGYNQSNQPIKINQKKLNKHFREHGNSGVFQVKIGNEQIPVKINEVQRDQIDGTFIHVDLQSIALNELVVMSVPLNFFGQALGVRNGGTVQQQLRNIKIRSLPANIPESIHVNIAELDIGDALYLREISLPTDVEVLHDLSTVVLTIVPPRTGDNESNQSVDEPEIVNARDGRGIDAAK